MDAVVESHDMYFILLGGWEPARVATGVVSWNYFEALGVRPMLGRSFVGSGRCGRMRAGTLILSYEYWQRAFKGDRRVIGRTVEMNDRPHTIVGVLPDVPMYPQANDVYMPRSACPFRMEPEERDRRGSGMAMRSDGASRPRRRRISKPISIAWARGSKRSIPSCTRLREAIASPRYPCARSSRATSNQPLSSCSARRDSSSLIVCASVANLSVARAMRRDRELALRTALGASTGRLFRQLFTEHLMLSLAGGAAGLLLAFIGMNLLVGYVQRFTTRASEIRIDSTVLLFTLGISMLTGLARRRHSRPLASLHADAAPRRTPAAAHRFVGQHLRRALIVAQVAASFMLLVGAGLMLRSLWKLTAVDPGFTTDHVLTMQIDMNFTKYQNSPLPCRVSRDAESSGCGWCLALCTSARQARCRSSRMRRRVSTTS